jgi:predicted nucleotidyltransferase
MLITPTQQKHIEVIAKTHQLQFVILHGSYATAKQRVGSDLDIAVVGENTIHSEQLLRLYGDLADVLGDDSERELDLKTLQHIDPLFRYLVVRDGILLFGNQTAYNEFKAFAYRDYIDSQDLRDQEKHLVKKNIHHLAQQYA